MKVNDIVPQQTAYIHWVDEVGFKLESTSWLGLK